MEEWINEIPTVPIYYLVKPQPREQAWQKQRGKKTLLSLTPSHNNPEEVANYMKAVDNLLKKFVSDIHGFNPYACQDAYKNFLYTLSLLLSKLDSTYFTNMDTQLVLDTIPDKECAAFLEHPEETADKVQQYVSSDNILTSTEVITKMCLDENITTFDKTGQQAVTHLFSHLQDAHNHMSQVAEAVVQLCKVSSPEQFTFVLKLAVRPIIQLKIPPHLSAPTELNFEKERLTQEETVEEYCCNLILPQPFHPKFSSISFKNPTRCLAAAAHFLIRKELFNSKYPQLQVAKDFAVAEKKLYLTASGRKYDPGKKAHKKDVPQVIIQQLPKHQLRRNNSQHEARPSRNNSQHKARPSLIPNKNMSHHKSAAMMMRNF